MARYYFDTRDNDKFVPDRRKKPASARDSNTFLFSGLASVQASMSAVNRLANKVHMFSASDSPRSESALLRSWSRTRL